MGVGEWKSRAHPFPLITGFSRKHIASCENWQEGLPVKCWKGEFGAMWIEYESGNCWQYRETASGLEWY